MLQHTAEDEEEEDEEDEEETVPQPTDVQISPVSQQNMPLHSVCPVLQPNEEEIEDEIEDEIEVEEEESDEALDEDGQKQDPSIQAPGRLPQVQAAPVFG